LTRPSTLSAPNRNIRNSWTNRAGELKETPVQAEVHRFRVGAFNCWAVNDGNVVCPTRILFANARQEEYDPVLQKHGFATQDESRFPYSSLYIECGKHRVLVDTGSGPYAPTCGRLAGDLRQMARLPRVR
jgi:hypothetical protein